MRVLVLLALLQEDQNEEKKEKEMWNVDIRLNEINCSSFLELFHAYTHTDAQTNAQTTLGLAILNCFWSSTSYAHTFSSEKMVLTYKDYKMACQTMANSKSSSWSFHLLDIILYLIQLNWNKKFEKNA